MWKHCSEQPCWSLAPEFLSIINLQVEHLNSPIAPSKDGTGQTQQAINSTENKNANLQGLTGHQEAFSSWSLQLLLLLWHNHHHDARPHTFKALMSQLPMLTRGNGSFSVILCYRTDGSNCNIGNTTLSTA